ncbi:MAG TPA: histidine kinase [Candidatus Dormibacteraeota bacterium]
MRRAAPAVLALAAGLLGVGTVLRLNDPIPITSGDAATVLMEIGVAVSYTIVGAFLASRRPANLVGWLLLVIGFGMSLFLLADEYAIHSLLVVPGSLPAGVLVAWVNRGLWTLVWFTLLPLTVVLFPTGRPLSRFWWGAWAPAGAGLVFALGAFFTPGPLTGAIRQSLDLHVENPVGIAFFTPMHLLQTPLFLVPFLIAGIAVLARWRAARADERQQLKWLTTAAALVPVFLAASLFIVNVPTISEPAKLVVAVVAFGPIWMGIPSAIAIAILRYRLYEIDIVISRALIYAALAAFITVVYVAIVVGLGAVIDSRGRPNLALSIVATAIVAVAFQPVRTRVETLANRLVFGYRASPYEALAAFSHRVAGGYANEDVLPRLAEVLAEGTGAILTTVWIRRAGQPFAAATWPPVEAPLPIGPADRVVEVRHQGEALGELTLKKRPGEPLTPVEEKLLNDLAAQAGQLLRNARLTAELQARLDEISVQAVELRASRQRIVAVQDAERRRLERNIHDGAQQHLVALAVKLRLAATIVKRDPVKAQRLLKELDTQTAEARQTVRDLAQGIYPPALRKGGLVEALRTQAEVTADGIGRYDAEIEAGVYFSCLEALQNATKYAKAAHIRVDLRQQNGTLTFTVIDDGVGFDPGATAIGTGVQNMKDRVASLGGRLLLESQPGKGTTVFGSLPLIPAGVAG